MSICLQTVHGDDLAVHGFSECDSKLRLPNACGTDNRNDGSASHGIDGSDTEKLDEMCMMR
jgi:hypothetical protein